MIYKCFSTIIKNYKYVFLVYCLLASSMSTVCPFGIESYMIGIVYLTCITLKNGHKCIGRRNLYIAFLITCFLTSIVNFVFDYRLLVFTIVIFASTPIFSSFKLFNPHCSKFQPIC